MALSREKILFLSDKGAEFFLYMLLISIPISKSLIAVYCSLALVCFLVKKYLDRDFSFLGKNIAFFLSLFFIFSVLSLIRSGDLWKTSVNALFFKWGRNILIFLMVADVMRGARKARNCVIIILGVGAVMGIDGLCQKFLGFEFLRHRPMIMTDEGVPAVTAALNHFNSFGAYLVVVLSLAAGLLVAGKLKKTYFWAVSALTALLGFCLLMTLSRGSWLGAVFSLILMMFLSRGYKPAFLLFAAMAAAFFIPDIRQRLLLGGDADRFLVWKTAFGMIKEHPFTGNGVGLFMQLFSVFRPELMPQYAHNCFLQLWAETGIFSLLSFLAFVFIIVYHSVKHLKEGPDPYLLGLVCGVGGFLVHSFFDTHLYSLQLATLFWFVLGLLCSAAVSEWKT